MGNFKLVTWWQRKIEKQGATIRKQQDRIEELEKRLEKAEKASV